MATHQTIKTFLETTKYNNIASGTVEFLNNGSAVLYPDLTIIFQFATMSPAETAQFLAYAGISLTPIPNKYMTQKYSAIVL